MPPADMQETLQALPSKVRSFSNGSGRYRSRLPCHQLQACAGYEYRWQWLCFDTALLEN